MATPPVTVALAHHVDALFAECWNAAPHVGALPSEAAPPDCVALTRVDGPVRSAFASPLRHPAHAAVATSLGWAREGGEVGAAQVRVRVTLAVTSAHVSIVVRRPSGLIDGSVFADESLVHALRRWAGLTDEPSIANASIKVPAVALDRPTDGSLR